MKVVSIITKVTESFIGFVKYLIGDFVFELIISLIIFVILLLLVILAPWIM